MSEQGVPVSEATAKDFMMVRAALVKRLGGANEALVWTRIDWRSQSKDAHRTEDGVHWWAASYPTIAEETGLTPEQARRAVESLVAGGYVRAEQHGGFARVRSYAPVYTHLAISPDGESARSKRRTRQMDLAKSPDVPLIETSETEDTPVVPRGDAADESFEQAWNLWPAPRRGTRKKSGSSWRTALAANGGPSHADVILDAIARDVAVWRTWPRSDVQYIPLLSTWLNQERWTGAPPLPRSGSRAQQRQDNNLALVAGYREEENRREEIRGGAAAGLLSIDRGA